MKAAGLADAVALPEGEAFFGFLSDPGDARHFDSWQISAAMALLAQALTAAPDATERRRFWSRVLPVLAASQEQRQQLEARLRDRFIAMPSNMPAGPTAGLASPAEAHRTAARSRAVALIVIALFLAALLAVGWNTRSAVSKSSSAPVPPPVTSEAPRPIELSRQDLSYFEQRLSAPVIREGLYDLARLLAITVPPLLIIGYVWWRRARDQQTLLRRAEGKWSTSVGALPGIDAGPGFHAIAHQLARPVLVPTQIIDVPRSTRETARRGGLFTPVVRYRRQLPEYLALIERQNTADHLASMATELVDQLRAAGLPIRRFYYSSDPRVLIEDRGGLSAETSLGKLSESNSAQTLIVIGGTEVFLQPMSRQPWPWTADFAGWSTRALLDPGPWALAEGVPLWGIGQARLGLAGWLIGTTRSASLERLARLERSPVEASPLLEGRKRPAARPARREAERREPVADETHNHASSIGKEIRRFEGNMGAVYSVAFSPDGTRVLTGNSDSTARLWNAATGEELICFQGNASAVYSVAFSPDGLRVLTGSGDKTARLWDVSSGKQLRRFEGDSDAVRSVAFSPDGKRVWTGSEDKNARLWDAINGMELSRFEGRSKRVDGFAFSPDGTQVLTGSNENTAHLWDAASGEELRSFEGLLHVWNAAFSADGTRVLAGSIDQTARLWDVTTGKELRRFEGHTDFVDSFAFSPDRTRVLTGSYDGTARLWDTSSGDEVSRFEGHTNTVRSVAFSPDGNRMLTGSDDGTARIWEVS